MRKRVKQTTAMLAAALILSNVAVPVTNSAVVYASEAAESVSTTLSQGVYYVPVSLMNASNVASPSMAAACVGNNAVLTVDASGKMSLQITLKTLSMMGLYGNATDIKVYSSYENYADSSLLDTSVISTRTAKTGSGSSIKEVTVPENVSFTLPYTDQDGVYIDMDVDAMGVRTSAFLKIDYSKALEASALAEQLKAAEVIVTSNYRAETVSVFTAAFEAAKEVVSASSVTAEQVKEAAAVLEAAMKALVLKDGVYTVPVSIYQGSKDSLSMVNGGINQTAKAVVKDGKVTLDLNFSQLVHYGVTGYISSVNTLANITEYSGNVPSVYDKVAATVVSTHDAVDAFNHPDTGMEGIAGTKYPNGVQITANAQDEYTWLHLYIPTMAAMGHGDQLVRLRTDYTKAVSAVSVSLNESAITLTAGTSKTLKATVEGSSEKAVFTTSNAKVAKVDANGKVTAVAAGTATITAAVNGKKATCKVTVKAAPTLSLAKTSATLYTKGTTSFILKATVTGDVTKAAFKTSNAKVAKVDANGKVTAVGAGTATITVTANGISKTCKVTVKKTSISLNKTKATIYTAGKTTVNLKASVVGADSKVTYTSSNKRIAKVSSTGKVTAVKAGTVTITAKANGVTTTCKITVKKPSLAVNKTKVTVKKNKKVTIKATATPSAKITFKSSNKKVATVSSTGVVKGVKKGTAKITVTSNGVKKTVTVTVK